MFISSEILEGLKGIKTESSDKTTATNIIDGTVDAREFLKKGDVAGWNNWIAEQRKNNPEAIIKISDLTFKNLDLSKSGQIDFKGCELSGVKISNCIFSADFSGASISNSKNISIISNSVIFCSNFKDFKAADNVIFNRNEFAQISPQPNADISNYPKPMRADIQDDKLKPADKQLNNCDVGESALFKEVVDNKKSDIKRLSSQSSHSVNVNKHSMDKSIALCDLRLDVDTKNNLSFSTCVLHTNYDRMSFFNGLSVQMGAEKTKDATSSWLEMDGAVKFVIHNDIAIKPAIGLLLEDQTINFKSNLMPNQDYNLGIVSSALKLSLQYKLSKVFSFDAEYTIPVFSDPNGFTSTNGHLTEQEKQKIRDSIHNYGIDNSHYGHFDYHSTGFAYQIRSFGKLNLDISPFANQHSFIKNLGFMIGVNYSPTEKLEYFDNAKISFVDITGVLLSTTEKESDITEKKGGTFTPTITLRYAVDDWYKKLHR